MSAGTPDLAARLDAELRAVSHRLRGHRDDPRDGVDDEIDLAVNGEQRELSAQTRAGLEHRRRLLVAALERLRAGMYGECLSCSSPIADARLLAVPEAQYCARCARDKEREAVADCFEAQWRGLTDVERANAEEFSVPTHLAPLAQRNIPIWFGSGDVRSFWISVKEDYYL